MEYHGICMEYVWNMHGICMEYVCILYGICVECVWNIMEYVWNMYAICMDEMFHMQKERRDMTMYMICLEYIRHVWNVYGTTQVVQIGAEGLRQETQLMRYWVTHVLTPLFKLHGFTRVLITARFYSAIG